MQNKLTSADLDKLGCLTRDDLVAYDGYALDCGIKLVMNAMPALLASARREGELWKLFGMLRDCYAEHRVSCARQIVDSDKCTCGLDELRERAVALGVEI